MPTIGLNFGHDGGAALAQPAGVHVIEGERQVGLRHVCGGNARFAESAGAWVNRLHELARGPVTAVAVADWYTPACRILPGGLVELVSEDITWSRPGDALATSVLRPVKSVDWPLADGPAGPLPVIAVRHHYAHAALAYYTSGADKAIALALDGTGNYAECGMVCLGDGTSLTPVLSFSNRTGPRFGLVYEALARRVHGGQFDTGKLLGLAATGTVDADLLPVLRTMLAGERARRAAPDLLAPLGGEAPAGSALRYEDTWYPYDEDAGGYLDGLLGDATDDDVVHSYGGVFPDEIRTPRGHRFLVGHSPGDPVCRNLAATLQAAVEEDLTHLVAGLHARWPGHPVLCYAGGCALNITANTRIAESRLFSRVHIPTCCDDSGIALGAALAVAAPQDRPASGGGPPGAEVAYGGPLLTARGPVRTGHTRTTLSSDAALAEHVAGMLAGRKCVAWLGGGMETGPRALGHRSLLVSPHWAGARRHVSQTIKRREWFRPVAPLCPAEVAGTYFAGPLDHTDTMLFAVRVREEHAERLAEVRHIDGTARLQTLHAGRHPLLHRLCHAVARRTGLPILINTSANGGGRPILNDLGDALELLDTTALDAVVLADERTVIT
ncbi:carbamoyltransferase C-terminal domain-containing protein [Streptomyces roseoverticillatus]|uniref:Carbamoyltransferase C-terminal domain-containing protein n=1 Tax=Streptomyces roseoverticillatus TaxID=66429 RepID=A0ABV3IR79_9ACTN